MSPAKRTRKAAAKAEEPEPAAVGVGQVNLLPGADRKAALGTKHVCFACEAKFYDMNKPEPVCPRCGADQRKRPKAASRRAPPPPPPPPPERVAPKPAPTSVEDDDPDDDDDSDDGFIDDDMEIDLEGIGGDDDDGLSDFPRASPTSDDDDRDG